MTASKISKVVLFIALSLLSGVFLTILSFIFWVVESGSDPNEIVSAGFPFIMAEGSKWGGEKSYFVSAILINLSFYVLIVAAISYRLFFREKSDVVEG